MSAARVVGAAGRLENQPVITTARRLEIVIAGDSDSAGIESGISDGCRSVGGAWRA
jgi:hypothetical protein